jgi:YEATS domain-containing protein 4
MGGGRRVKNVAVSRPIIYGNLAVPLKPSERTADTPADHTHKWTIFIRDPTDKDADLSYFIKKVIFKLHDTYNQPSRSIEEPPFEVTETGWGEFEISIRVFFVSQAGEKNILLYHHLKLHPYGQNAPAPATEDGAEQPKQDLKPVDSYVYDEFVFNEPTEAMFEILTSRPGALLPAKKSETINYSLQTESEEIDRLSIAMDNVYQQVQRSKEKIKDLEKELSGIQGE